MDKFISDFVSVNKSDQIIRAAFLLHEAKVDKISLNRIAEKLKTSSMYASISLTRVNPGGRTSGNSINMALNEAFSRIAEYFNSSNNISFVVENTKNILLAETKALEDELISLERAIESYAFLLADGMSYDFSFIETFNDENTQEDFIFSQEFLPGEKIFAPDRDGIDFSLAQIAAIETSEGILKLPNKQDLSYSLKAVLHDANCISLASNNRSVFNLGSTLNTDPSGWNAAFLSPSPIRSSVDGINSFYGGTYLFAGAQTVLKYYMDDENPVDNITISPCSQIPVQLVQIVGYDNDNLKDGIELMSSPITLGKPYNIFFPANSYKVFLIYLSQNTYVRDIDSAMRSEVVHDQLNHSQVMEENSNNENGFNIQKIGLTGRIRSNSRREKNSFKLEPYWKTILSNLQVSLGEKSTQLFDQGIPTVREMDYGFHAALRNRFVDENGSEKFREELSSTRNKNSTFMNSIIKRFLGTHQDGVGSYFKAPQTIMYNTVSPNSFQNNQMNMSPTKRVASYSRFGDSENVFPIEFLEENLRDSSVSYWQEKIGKWVENDPRRIENFIDNYSIRAESETVVKQAMQVPAGGSADAFSPTDVNILDPYNSDKSYMYRYNIGLKSVSAKLTGFADKAAYISKKLSGAGGVVEVKLKESSTNFTLTNQNFDSEIITSIEYSVTNSQNIGKEENWIPIFPSNLSRVRGERIFPDSTGVAKLRFLSDGNNIQVYKNNIILDEIDSQSFFLRKDNTSLVYGVRMPSKYFNSTDLFTCDYSPIDDAKTINFDNYTNNSNSLTPAMDDDGRGEKLNLGLKEYQLENSPYINYDEVNGSQYSTSLGMYPYSPITIVMDDGTTATNLTNYTGGTQGQLDSSNVGYQFLHSEQYILFNKVTEVGFKVYYSYYPSNLRVRVVLRNNSNQIVSPKVDFYQVKTKSKKSNPERY